jgi:hypothetical protein
MTDVAFWPQRAPRRRRHVWVVLVAVALVFIVSGPRLVIDARDLRCPAGSAIRPVSVAYWAVECAPGYPGPMSQPISRYVGLFLKNVDVRIFAVDALAGVIEGPALNVRVR